MHWPRHLGRDLHANLIGDAVAQVLTLALWYWHVRVGWLLVAWLVRWLIFAAVLATEVLRRQRRRAAALATVVAGHGIGTILSVLIVPELVPLSMFVLVSDLLCVVHYDHEHAHRVQVAVAATFAGIVAVLSLQSWTGLAGRVPRPLFVAFIVGHALATGSLFALQAAQGRRELAANAAALRRAARRLAATGLEQRRAIADDLRAGPGRTLVRLAGEVAAVRATVARGDAAPAQVQQAELAVAAAQRASAELREFAHGVYPASLRRHGLAAALRVRAARASFPLHSTVATELDEDEATFAYFVIDAALAWAARHVPLAEPGDEAASVRASATVERAHGVLRIEVVLDGVAPALPRVPDLCAALQDRCNAAGADAEIRDRGASATTGEPGGTTEVLVFRPPAPTGAHTSPRPGSAPATSMVGATPPIRVGTVVAICGLVAVLGLTITAVAPELVPVGAAAAMAPLFVALPRLGARPVWALGVGQTFVGGVIAMVGLLRTPAWEAGYWPWWLAATVASIGTAATVAAVGSLLVRTNADLAHQTVVMRATHQRLLAADDAERRRVEQDLHDGGQQRLVALALQLRALVRSWGDPVRARQLAADADAQVREAGAELLRLAEGEAGALLADGLTPALARLADAHRAELDAADAALDAVEEVVGLAVYFCVAEAVQNARKHAGPGASVRIRLRRAGEEVHFEVHDDGPGFDGAATLTDGASLGTGLANLRERVSALGGDLSIRSGSPGGADGWGTTVTGRLPTAAPLSVPIGTAARP